MSFCFLAALCNKSLFQESELTSRKEQDFSISVFPLSVLLLPLLMSVMLLLLLMVYAPITTALNVIIANSLTIFLSVVSDSIPVFYSSFD